LYISDTAGGTSGEVGLTRFRTGRVFIASGLKVHHFIAVWCLI